MKRYYVIMSLNGMQWGFSVHARSKDSARNKAVKRARVETDPAITAGNIESVTYEGFYLACKFIAVNPSIKAL